MSDESMPPQALPHDIQAEMGVLGSMLLSPDAIYMARERLEEASFYNLAHQDIFSAVLELSDSRNTVDLILLRDELNRQGKLQKAGGAAYLTELMEAVPTSANVEYYIEIVHDKAIRRELIGTATGILKSSQADGQDVDDLLDEAEQKMLAVRHLRESARRRDMNSVLLELLPRLEQLHQSPQACTGLPTGFGDLDRITSGFQPGELIVVAARPSVGKTSLALNILDHVCITERRPAVLYTLETRAQQIVSNLLCLRYSLDTQDFRSGMLNEEQWAKVEESVQEFADAPLYIDDSASLRIGDLRARARRMRNQHGVELIVVDYLQLVRPGRSRDARAVEVAEISAGLKALSRELEVPVLAVAQLNRAVEKEQRKPRMSDLRESGAIEQDADVVMLLHRPDEPGSEEFAASSKRRPGMGSQEVPGSPADVIVAKQRNGPTDVCHLVFWKRFLRFEPGSTHANM